MHEGHDGVSVFVSVVMLVMTLAGELEQADVTLVVETTVENIVVPLHVLGAAVQEAGEVTVVAGKVTVRVVGVQLLIGPTGEQEGPEVTVIGGSVNVETDGRQEAEEHGPDTVSVEVNVLGLQVWPPPVVVQLSVNTDVTGGNVSVVVLAQEVITEVGPGISDMDGEQVPTPPPLVHELIVTVFDTVIVLPVASQLPQVEDPPETPPTSLLVLEPPP